LWTLKSFVALVFAEANLLVVSDFPEHNGDLRLDKPMGVEIPSIFKPSILDAGVIHFTLVVTTSCKFSERERLSTCKLYSELYSKTQFLKRFSLDFSAFKNANFHSTIPISFPTQICALSAPTSTVFFNCNVFSSTQSQALLTTKGTTSKHTEYNAGCVCLCGIQSLVAFISLILVK